MLNNIKIGTKLIAGFLIVCLIAVIIGILGITSTAKMDYATHDLYKRGLTGIKNAEDVVTANLRMERAYRNIVIFNEAERIAMYERNLKDYNDSFLALLDSLHNLSQLAETRNDIQKARNAFRDYVNAGTELTRLAKDPKSDDKEVNKALVRLRDLGDIVEHALEDVEGRFMKVAEDINNNATIEYHNTRNMLIILLIVGVILGVALGYYLATSISRPISKAVEMIDEMAKGHLTMRLNMERKDEIGSMTRRMDSFADYLQTNVVGVMQQISAGDLSANVKAVDSGDVIGPALQGTINTLRDLITNDGGKVLEAAASKDLSQRLTKEYKGEYNKMKNNINSVVQSLDQAMSQVSEAAAQVSSASGEISAGSQQLAEGSNEQASSLEEVSSSLEEMSSMTKQNADNSNQAKLLAGEARNAANEGDAAMKNMANAINQIKQSSDNTAKIVKTIDDIAFQTNLLALNAAVEAARAGEAGKGFAVVAEEVRNLAMRSAEAAKNTTEMIEESVRNADGGVKITEEVAKSLGQIVDRVGKVGDLIAEIAAASNEQAQGIEQVNTAVAQMNQVTQQNAANSEESASAAEELSSQAAELQNMVAAFTLSAGGSRPSTARRSLPPPAPKAQAAIPDKRASKPKALPPAAGKAVKAEQIIPLDDDELGEF